MARLPYSPLPMTYDINSPENFVQGEIHTLRAVSGNRSRLVVLENAKFYTEGTVIRDEKGKVLKRGVDYRLVRMDEYITFITGNETASLILIDNTALTGNISVDYHAAGGGYLVVNEALKAELANTSDQSLSSEYSKIFNPPREFVPEAHRHYWSDLYGFDDFIRPINYLTKLVQNKHTTPFTEKLLDRHLARAQRQVMRMDNIRDRLNTHVDDTNVPHHTTRADIGLADLPDFPIATREEVDQLRNDQLMFATDGIDWLNVHIRYPVEQHIVSRDNPHRITTKQLNTFSKEEFDALLNGYVRRDEPVRVAETLNHYSFDALKKEIGSTLSINGIQGDVIPPVRLGGGSGKTDTLLVGSGNFKSIQQIIKDNAQTKTEWTFHRFAAGWTGTIAEAKQIIEKTYTDHGKWPVNSVVFFSHTQTFISKKQVKGKAERRFNQVRFAVRMSDWSWEVV